MAHIDWIGTVLFPLIAMISGFPLLGWAKPVPVQIRNLRSPYRDFAVIAAAGPISNLLIALAVAGLVLVAGGAASFPPGMMRNLIIAGVATNCVLAVFNLIPVPPLDGGNVAIGLLPPPLARALSQLQPFGILILYGLMFAGVLGRVVLPIAYGIADWLI